MRILTYTNPFKINDKTEIWKILKNSPQYCASDTFVQGLATEYGRNEFNVLRTVNDLAESVIGSFVSYSNIEMQLYVQLLDEIRNIKDINIQSSFFNNSQSVMQTIKELLLLEYQEELFDKKNLSVEQNVLLSIYKNLRKHESLDSFYKTGSMSRVDFYTCVKYSIISELEYFLTSKPDYLESLSISKYINSLNEFEEKLDLLINYLEEKLCCVDDDLNKYNTVGYDLKLLKHIRKIYNEFDIHRNVPIVINGVHKFTPELIRIISLAEGLGIEVIFVINCASNFKTIFNTWKEVYRWTGCEFEFLEEVDIEGGKLIGIEFGKLMDGQISFGSHIQSIIRYPNITSFTDGEVRKQFKKAQKRVGNNKALSSMKKQYYAVKGDESNEILKNYFPEQFSFKPFLSYPVGQFIRAIYEMWNFENNEITINWDLINDCIISGLYKSNINLLDVFTKTKLYFSDIDSISALNTRLKKLKDACFIVKNNNRFNQLKYISFFNVDDEEIDNLMQFIFFIQKLSERIFLSSTIEIDFNVHFRKMVELIEQQSVGDSNVSRVEELLVTELLDRLSSLSDEDAITGNIKDVKEALYYFLADRNKKDTSNWIVRGFEQLDGAVLHRKRKGKTSKDILHIGMLSNENMMKSRSDLLSWPLDENMLSSYKKLKSAFDIMHICNEEVNNYYRYLLFYSMFFSKGKIELSYVANENDTIQIPYKLLEIIGIREVDCDYSNKRIKGNIIQTILETSFPSESVNIEDKEIFSVCPYKFFMKHVLDEDIEYINEYQIKYFLVNFIVQSIPEKFKSNLDSCVGYIDNLIDSIRNLFDFWNEIEFTDLKYTALQEITKHLNSVGTYSSQYVRRKNNFLIAQWTNQMTGEKYMNFDIEDNEIERYMCDSELMRKEYLPFVKICESCNFNKVCLANYSMNYSLS